jgi:hypothetical protein
MLAQSQWVLGTGRRHEATRLASGEGARGIGRGMDEGCVEAGGMEGVMSYEARICTLPHDKATALAQQRPSLAGTELRRAPKPATRETAKGLLCIGRHHTHLRQLDCQAASASLRLCVSACLPVCLSARLPPVVWWHRMWQHARLRAGSRELRHSVLTT